MRAIEQYTYIEISLEGTTFANRQQAYIPDCAIFTSGEDSVVTGAFWKRDHYVVRFMPTIPGEWDYQIRIEEAKEDCEITGSFTCVASAGNNHGRVVAKGVNFQYEDGSRYLPFGTTCYAWVNQTKELQEETIRTLGENCFNKIRMCVFPKSMPYNNNEPDYFPFTKRANGTWNVDDPVEEFWSNLDLRIQQLMELGIECDLIVFHPYDLWGFATMSQEDSLQYLNYCIYRLGPYRNLWWSLANEYETVYEKTIADWDEYGELLAKRDIYHHLISVHNIITEYPKRDWMTHMSMQTIDFDHIRAWQEEYEMPVIIDECGYEGNLEFGWGNLTAMQEVHYFWTSFMRGGFCTHGETFHREDEVLWWAKGGKLYGKSPARIAFLKEILYSLPGEWVSADIPPINPNMDGLDPEAVKNQQNWNNVLSKIAPERLYGVRMGFSPLALWGEHFRLQYCGRACPFQVTVDLDESKTYRIEVIDAYDMTRQEVMTGVSGQVTIPLPSKECMAVLCMEM